MAIFRLKSEFKSAAEGYSFDVCGALSHGLGFPQLGSFTSGEQVIAMDGIVTFGTSGVEGGNGLYSLRDEVPDDWAVVALDSSTCLIEDLATGDQWEPNNIWTLQVGSGAGTDLNAVYYFTFARIGAGRDDIFPFADAGAEYELEITGNIILPEPPVKSVALLNTKAMIHPMM